METLLVAASDADDTSGEDTVWSLAELMQACALMTTFHSHCTLSYGLGCSADGEFPSDELQVDEIPEVLHDHDRAENLSKLTEKHLKAPAVSPEEDEKAIQAFNSIQPVDFDSHPISTLGDDIGLSSSSPGTPEGEQSDANGSRAVKKKPTRKLDDSEKKKIRDIMDEGPESPATAGAWLREIEPDQIRNLMYEEVPQKLKKGLVSDSEWSWEEDAMTMIAQFYSEECAENFNTSYTYSHRYTNHCIGDRSYGDRTDLLREALHNYVRQVCNLAWKDDFDYNTMNMILPIVVKVYLKKIVCYPERLTRSNFEWVKQQQGYSTFDMTQLAMIGAETRRVCSMLHVTRAMKLYLRTRS